MEIQRGGGTWGQSQLSCNHFSETKLGCFDFAPRGDHRAAGLVRSCRGDGRGLCWKQTHDGDGGAKTGKIYILIFVFLHFQNLLGNLRESSPCAQPHSLKASSEPVYDRVHGSPGRPIRYANASCIPAQIAFLGNDPSSFRACGDHDRASCRKPLPHPPEPRHLRLVRNAASFASGC